MPGVSSQKPLSSKPPLYTTFEMVSEEAFKLPRKHEPLDVYKNLQRNHDCLLDTSVALFL
jgi:hypothetical protein